MKRIVLASEGILVLLFGVVALGLTQAVSIRPFSWNIYWSITSLSWLIAVLCIPSGFYTWRKAVRQIRVEHTKTVD